MPSWFTIKFSLISIGALLAVLATTITVEEIRIGRWKADLTEEQRLHGICKTNLTTSENNNVVLKQTVLDQNVAIEEWKAAALAAQKAAHDRALEILALGKKKMALVGSGFKAMNDKMKELYQ